MNPPTIIRGEQDQFIDVGFRAIVDSLSRQYLKNAVDGPKHTKDFQDFSENIMLSVNGFYSKLTGTVKEYWMNSHSSMASQDTAVLNVFQTLLHASQYNQLRSFKMAVETSYEFNFPVMIHWGKTDSELLVQWYLDNGIYDNEESVPDFAKHILICTRGATTEKKSGLFLWEKIDILLERSGLRIWEKIFKLRKTKSEVEAEAKEMNDEEKSKAMNRTKKEEKRHTSNTGSVFGDSNLNRKTIGDCVAEHGWKSLFKSSDIEEPIFENVVLVYRAKDERKYTTTRNQIQIHQFTKIPFGDLEALLPYKTIQLAPLDSVKFSIQVALIMSFIHMSLADLYYPSEEEEGSQSYYLVGLLLIGLLSRLASLIMYYLSIVTFYERDLDEWLQKKREGRNSATLSKICDEVCVQEAKEMLLAYFFLWRLGPMTLQELDGKVERFLEKEFKKQIDFDAEDAIAKLVSVQLVNPTDQTLMDSFANCSFATALSGADKFEITVTPEEWLELHPMKHIQELRIR